MSKVIDSLLKSIEIAILEEMCDDPDIGPSYYEYEREGNSLIVSPNCFSREWIDVKGEKYKITIEEL